VRQRSRLEAARHFHHIQKQECKYPQRDLERSKMNFVLNDALAGLGGGMLIGLAAAILLLGNGRIAGVSGILGALVNTKLPALWAENLLFVAGLAVAPVIYTLTVGQPDIDITTSLPLLIAGGVWSASVHGSAPAAPAATACAACHDCPSAPSSPP
jgi:cytochrome c553